MNVWLTRSDIYIAVEKINRYTLPIVPFGNNALESVSGLARINGSGTMRLRLNTCRSLVSSMSSTSYLFVVELYVTISANIQLSSSSMPLTNAATMSPGLATYVLSAGIAPHNGGVFSPGLLTNSGNVCAEICSIFIKAPRRIVSLLPAFLAWNDQKSLQSNVNVSNLTRWCLTWMRRSFRIFRISKILANAWRRTFSSWTASFIHILYWLRNLCCAEFDFSSPPYFSCKRYKLFKFVSFRRRSLSISWIRTCIAFKRSCNQPLSMNYSTSPKEWLKIVRKLLELAERLLLRSVAFCWRVFFIRVRDMVFTKGQNKKCAIVWFFYPIRLCSK